MKRYPESKPDEPIDVVHISGIPIPSELKLMPGDEAIIEVSVRRLADDPALVVWTVLGSALIGARIETPHGPGKVVRV